MDTKQTGSDQNRASRRLADARCLTPIACLSDMSVSPCSGPVPARMRRADCSLRPAQGLGLRGVVELPRHLRRRSIDAFFPLVPSESLVIIAGNLASSAIYVLLGVLACAAGAILGDNICYLIGSWAGERTVKRLFRLTSRHGFEWAERTLDEPAPTSLSSRRFIPGAVRQSRSRPGTADMPWRRFIVSDVVAGVLWGTYAALLGYFGGKSSRITRSRRSRLRSGSR